MNNPSYRDVPVVVKKHSSILRSPQIAALLTQSPRVSLSTTYNLISTTCIWFSFILLKPTQMSTGEGCSQDWLLNQEQCLIAELSFHNLTPKPWSHNYIPVTSGSVLFRPVCVVVHPVTRVSGKKNRDWHYWFHLNPPSDPTFKIYKIWWTLEQQSLCTTNNFPLIP